MRSYGNLTFSLWLFGISLPFIHTGSRPPNEVMTSHNLLINERNLLILCFFGCCCFRVGVPQNTDLYPMYFSVLFCSHFYIDRPITSLCIPNIMQQNNIKNVCAHDLSHIVIGSVLFRVVDVSFQCLTKPPCQKAKGPLGLTAWGGRVAKYVLK